MLARIPMLVFGAFDMKAGACGTLFNITSDRRLNHRVNVIPGILDTPSAELLGAFLPPGKRRNHRNNLHNQLC